MRRASRAEDENAVGLDERRGDRFFDHDVAAAPDEDLRDFRVAHGRRGDHDRLGLFGHFIQRPQKGNPEGPAHVFGAVVVPVGSTPTQRTPRMTEAIRA